MHGLPRPSRPRRARDGLRDLRALGTVFVAAALALTTAACGVTAGLGDEPAASDPAASQPAVDEPPASAASTTTPATAAPTTGPVVASSVASTSTTTTSPPTTTTTTTTTVPAPGPTLPTVPIEPGALDLSSDLVGLGFSHEGRPIFAERYGTPGGRRVLVVGVIHGNEDDGLAIVDTLRRREVPAGIELWLVESMNPDGVANQDRHNANDVDLNRNFPYKWGPIGQPGDSQYAGAGPASEPETQAMVNFIAQLQPDIAIWYHQDAYLVIPSTGRDGRIRARYAELTGLPLADCCGGGGIFTGIAATWAREELKPVEGVAFIVELGGTTSPDEVATHADAVLTIAAEG